MSEPRLETFRGDALAPLLPELARLRITVFREFPYLYEGDAESEQRYLRRYAASPAAAVVIAFDGARVIGAATCLPLINETAAVQAPFLQAGLDVRRFWYFGESVLLPAWRGQGLGVRFFAAREDAATGDPSADFACFCAIERPADHPARPARWQPLDSFWRRRGFTRYPGLSCVMSWKETGSLHETEHSLVFWLRSLSGAALPDMRGDAP